MNPWQSEGWNEYFLVIRDFQTSRELNELISGKARAFEDESLPQSDLKSTCVLVILIKA